MGKTVSFENLSTAALVPGNIYKGGQRGNVGDDPFNKLLGVGNAGGIRPKKNQDNELAYVLLISNNSNQHEYPDCFDSSTNVLTYYGDQRKPNLDYLTTKQRGNLNLENLFIDTHAGKTSNPFPCFYFQRVGSKGRDYKYIGLAYPFVNSKKNSKSYSLVKREVGEGVVQNLRFLFWIDDTSTISRAWLDFLVTGQRARKVEAPESWNMKISKSSNK